VVSIGPDAQGAERLLISKGYGGGSSLFSVSHDDKNRWTTASLWKQPKLLKTKFSNVAVLNGFGYALSDGILECVELAPGRRCWKQGHFDYGQILRANDLLLVESEQGEVALVAASPEEYHEFGRFQALDDQTWNTLCLWGGRYLLVRNSQEAACYELPLAK
jgi:outer membrane protein assembly factor BamB